MQLTLQRQRSVLFLLGAFAFLSCAGAAPAAEPLRWKFERGGEHYYRLNQLVEMTMDVPEQGLKSVKIDQIMNMTWRVKEVDEAGNAVIEQTIERVRMKLQYPGAPPVEYDSASKEPPKDLAAMMAPTLKALTQGSLMMTMSPSGKVSNVEIDEELVKALQSSPGAAMMGEMGSEAGLKNMARQASIEFPETLDDDQEWSSKLEMNAMPGAKLTVETTYRYAGAKDVDGREYESIVPSMEMKFGGGGGFGGSQVEVKKQESNGEILFDRDAGIMHSSSLKQELDLLVTGPDGQPMDQKMVQTVQLKRVASHEEQDETEE